MESIFDLQDFKYEDYLPDEKTFKTICDSYTDIKTKGEDCSWSSEPDTIARITGSPDAVVKKLTVAIIIHWNELKNELADRWRALGWSTSELKEMLQYVVSKINSFEDLIKKYCDPITNEIK